MDPSGTKKIRSAVIAVPPVTDFYFTPSRASALGAAVLQALLKQSGSITELFNFPAWKIKPAKLPLPQELSHLGPHIMPGEYGPVSFFTKYRRFGPHPDKCAELLAPDGRRPPEAVFISCFAWAYAQDAADLAAAVKKRLPETIIIAGGAGVTVNPGWFKTGPNAAAFDLILPGRAETSLKQILPQAASHRTDTPPFCITETGVSRNKGIRYYSTMLTRGCPKHCRFCANHLVHGREFKKADINEVASAVRQLPDDMNIHINFEDDNLLYAKDYFFEVLRIIRKRFPNAGFTAENGLDYTLLDTACTEKLIALGFRSFNLSMASSSQTLLKNQARKAEPDRLKEVVETAAARGTASTTYFICGLEGDSTETVINNLAILHRLPTLTGISMFYPVPGLPGFSPESLINKPPRLCAGSSAYPWTGSMSTSELVTAFRLARLSNMIKTSKQRIPSAGHQSNDAGNLSIIFQNTGRLHSLVKGSAEPVEVTCQDRRLTGAFLDLL